MKYFALIAGILLTMSSWSQNMDFAFRGKIDNFDLGKKEGGVIISMVQGGRTVSSVQSASSGKYVLKGNLDPKQSFEVVFSKAGFVSKKVAFDFSKMNPEDTPASSEYSPLESLDMEIFKERSNVDFSFLSTEPVAKFDWNSNQLTPRLDAVSANKMRSKITDLLNKAEADKAKLEADYLAAIRAGDSAYDTKEYEKALAKYEEALGYKPTEQYPVDRINELDALIQAQKEEDLKNQQARAAYDAAIKTADELRDASSLEQAVSKYQEASRLKPDEQYPKDQITALNAEIARLDKEKENEEKYQAAIKSGDQFMKQNSLRPARDKFELAAKLKPSEQYPKDKLTEIESKMKELEKQEALKKEYDDAIAAADAAFDLEDFKTAKGKYEEALAIESSSTYAKGRIALCDEKIAADLEEQERLAKLAELLAKGDTEFKEEEYATAKGTYAEVLTVDPGNSTATERLALIDQKIKEAEELASQEEQFNNLVEQGDEADAGEKYEEAISKYNEALVVKASPEVAKKIEGVQKKLDLQRDAAAKKAEYEKLIDEAQALMDGDKMEEARSKFQQAGSVDPKQSLPGEKIAEIDGLIAERDANAAKEKQYNDLMSEASNLFSVDKLEQAKAKYQEALTVDSSKPEPSERIAEIDLLIAKRAEDAEREANYNEAIAEANKRFEADNWESAAEKYREALEIKPGDSYASERVSAIDNLIAKQKEAEERQQKIDDLLAEGNDLFNNDKLEDARGKYQEVLTLDPGNREAENKVSKINDELANRKSESEREEAFNALKEEGFKLADDERYQESTQKLEEALSLKSDQEVQNKLLEIEHKMREQNQMALLEERYNKLIEEAGNKESEDDLRGAIKSYQDASKLKPEESFPKDKIAELGQTIAQRAKDAEAIEKDYAAAMDRGNDLLADNDFNGAISAYTEALSIKPEEKEPKEKIEEAKRRELAQNEAAIAFEQLLADARTQISAGELRRAEELLNRAKNEEPGDDRPQKMLDEIAEIIKVRAEYDGLMSSAESKASSKDYEAAIEYFEKAKQLILSESKPDKRIADMNRLIAQEGDTKEMEELYADNMRKGGLAEGAERFEEALSFYQNALGVKAGDRAAQDKVNEMQQILDDLANANDEERKKRENFDRIMKEADLLFADGKFVPEAKDKYEEALAIFPSSMEAKTQRDESIRRAKDLVDAEKDKTYRNVIKAADNAFDIENYEKAKELYTRATGFRDSDPYPKKRLEEIENILNPPIIGSVELTDLGDPYSGSILDGVALLEDAERKRALLKGKQIQSEFEEIYSQHEDLTDRKSEQRRETINDIYQLQQSITLEVKDADDRRLDNVEAMDKIEDAYQDGIRVNTSFENSENLSSQGELDRIESEGASAYAEDASVYQENTQKVKRINEAEIDSRERLTKSEYGVNIKDQGQLDNHERVNSIQYQEDIKVYQDNTEKVKRINESEIDSRERLTKSEYGANIKDQGQLDNVERVNSIQYQEDIKVYQDNTEKVKGIVYEENVDRTQKSSNEQLEVLGVSQELDQIELDIAKEYKTDYDERIDTDIALDYSADYAQDESIARTRSKYDILLNQQETLNEVEKKVESKATEDDKSSRSNNEELKGIQLEVIESENVKNFEEERLAFKADGEIAQVKRKVESDSEDFGKIREAATQDLKEYQSDLATAQNQAYKEESMRHLEDQATLDKEEEKQTSVIAIANERHADKVEYVERMDKRAHETTVAGTEGDLEDRLKADKSMSEVELTIEEKAVAEQKKHVENSKKLEDISVTLSRQQAQAQQEKTDKNREAQQVLDQIDNKPKDKVKVANELGEEYPEGVSQESFTRKDQNGLVTAVITRRVVVIDGHADVYVRTQTSNGTTYNKNGNPIVQHVWNSETQGPHLERHF